MSPLLSWSRTTTAARALPSARPEEKARALFLVALSCSIFAPGSIAQLAVDAGARGLRGLAFAIANLVIFGLLAASSRRALGRSHADLLMFAVGVVLVLDFVFAGPCTHDGKNEVLVFVGVVPLAMSVWSPWRMRDLLALSAVAVSGLVVTHLLAGRPASELAIPLWMALASASLSLVASTRTRHVGMSKDLEKNLQETRAQLIASERMSVLGKMTAGLAHELKTPLSAAMNGTETLGALIAELNESIGHAAVTEEDLREIVGEANSNLKIVNAGLRRSTQFIQAIRAQTVNLNETQCDAFRIADVVGGVVTLMSHSSKAASVALDTEALDQRLTLRGDAGKMGQVITNLLANAIDACSAARKGTRIAISARAGDGGVHIVIADDGPGIPEPLRVRIFEPLFTTKAKSGGTGLGLAIVRDIIEGAFGGTIRVAPSDVGARFEIFCPDGAARAARAPAWIPAHAA